MSSETGYDTNVSGAKIEPLDSKQKYNTTHDNTGVIGEDQAVDQGRIDPLGGKGQGQHPAPHADSQGVVGRDDIVQGSKIEPMEGGFKQAGQGSQGLDDESVDASRIKPMGEVREDMS